MTIMMMIMMMKDGTYITRIRTRMSKTGPASQYPLLKLFIMPRAIRKAVLFQFLLFVCILFIWIRFNGGLLPKFVHEKFRQRSDMDILTYYSEIDEDASRIIWERDVNTEQAVYLALQGQAMILVADVILRGQGTARQQQIPVMSRPPYSDSDLLFTDWISKVAESKKPFKLNFHFIDAVSLTLQNLSEHKDKLTRPVWLSANVLKGPLTQTNPVDGKRFLRAIKDQFPECTISLGWTTGFHTDLSQAGYTWAMVIEMYDLVHEFYLEKRPLDFHVRLSLIHNSIPQLKWLCDNTGATLTIIHESEDEASEENLMYAAYKIMPKKLFFDLDHQDLQMKLSAQRHGSKKYLNELVHRRESVMFRPKAWLNIGYHEYEKATLASTESVVLFTPNVILVSKTHYAPTEKLRLNGRVQFLPHEGEMDSESGLYIFFRTKDHLHPEHVSGIRVFIGVFGNIRVSNENISPKKFGNSHNVTPSLAKCYRFGIINDLEYLKVNVNVLHDCNKLDSVVANSESHVDMTVNIPTGVTVLDYPIVLQTADRKATVIMDELNVQYSQKGKFML